MDIIDIETLKKLPKEQVLYMVERNAELRDQKRLEKKIDERHYRQEAEWEKQRDFGEFMRANS